MIDSRCGLHCAGCSWKGSHGCGECVETNGHPFHGQCPIAACCQEKGYAHCGECDRIPCDKLYAYSYLDPEHGDKPQGARVEQCRRWAAESGIHKWENVLLTDSAFYMPNDRFGLDQPLTKIIDRFAKMVGKPFADVKVLFISAAVQNDSDAKSAVIFRAELSLLGIPQENHTVYDVDGTLSLEQAMRHDVIFFTGGDRRHLMRRIKETGFDAIIKKMVYSNKVYVGVSAGSGIAGADITNTCEKETAGLCLINAFISCHNPEGSIVRTDSSLPHIFLSEGQALAVSWRGYELIEK